ncbi:chromosomal replication initiator protein DnaA [Candidatus Roizmanbacteria bacterium]|nr:chromosomal replication initiator protein DnaA [Candidatus Roizmanbacteria bacterium]
MQFLSSFWVQFLESLVKNKEKHSLLYSLLNQLKPLELSEDKIVLGCQNQVLRLYLEKKLYEIESALSSHIGKKFKAEFTIIQSKKKPKAAPLFNFQPTLGDLFYKTGLHAKYSFDNFAVSSTNQVAYAAAQAVTNGLGHTYNPLVLYGGVGVGKTHLAQAIGRNTLERDQNKKIFFCPSDQFTNELIESIREKSTPGFRRKYRRLSLLIVDDAQFIAGKEKVQEEFFHTFNSLISAGGQVILTTDRPPSEIKNLEDRLRSRFLGGLTVDIQPPDFELRSAILLIKAREKNIEIDIEAAKIIAENISDSRALEGTLLTLYSKILGKKERIDLESVDQFFSKRQEAVIKKLVPQDVLKIICSFYNIRQSHLKGNSRTSNLVLPRQIAMFILRNQLKMKLEEIAYFLNRKDHTTVMHATEKVSRLLIKDPLIKREVDQIIQSLSLSA